MALSKCLFGLFLIFFIALVYTPRVSASRIIYNQLSLDEKIGQLLIIGISNDKVDKDLVEHLNKVKPGGIILFKKNISSEHKLLDFNSEIQRHVKAPLFIAVDQEGGTVTRIKTVPRLPSARWIGSVGDANLTKRLGKSLGKILRAHGINMNLAPVLDVSDKNTNTFLGSRSYSDNPEVVANIGTAFSAGLLSAGVLPTAKHFPGLGSIKGDLHDHAVENSASYKEMQLSHLAPFRKFSALSTSALMLSHASYPALDSSNKPATFSSLISKNILRNDLGYNGLVVTDDLMMGGARGTSSFEDNLSAALNSGADLLLFAWSKKSQLRAKRALLSAVKSGKINMNTLDEKVFRIIKTKQQLADLARNNSRSVSSDLESEFKNIIYKMSLVKRSRAR